MDKHGITFYTTYISVDIAHHEIFRAQVGKGGIKTTKHSVIRMRIIKWKVFLSKRSYVHSHIAPSATRFQKIVEPAHKSLVHVYVSHVKAMKAHVSLYNCANSPEPSQFA